MSQVKPAEKKRLALSISGISPTTKNEFVGLAHTLDMTQSQLLERLLSSYKDFHVELSREENELFNKARDLTPVAYGRKIKRAILRHAKTILSPKTEHNKPVDINLKNSPRAADKRADNLLEMVLNHNNEAKEWYNKMYISKTALVEYSNKLKELNPDMQQCNKSVINRCLERQAELIAEHHKKHDLQEGHNIKAHYERLKVSKEQQKEEVEQ